MVVEAEDCQTEDRGAIGSLEEASMNCSAGVPLTTPDTRTPNTGISSSSSLSSGGGGGGRPGAETPNTLVPIERGLFTVVFLVEGAPAGAS